MRFAIGDRVWYWPNVWYYNTIGERTGTIIGIKDKTTWRPYVVRWDNPNRAPSRVAEYSLEPLREHDQSVSPRPCLPVGARVRHEYPGVVRLGYVVRANTEQAFIKWDGAWRSSWVEFRNLDVIAIPGADVEQPDIELAEKLETLVDAVGVAHETGVENVDMSHISRIFAAYEKLVASPTIPERPEDV